MTKERDAQEIQTDILIRESEEEIRNEQIKETLRKHRWLIVALVVIAVFSSIAFEGYHSWWEKVRLSDSDTYEQASVLCAKGKVDEAIVTYQSLENAKTSYQYLSKMRIAGIYFDHGKKKEGLEVLNDLRQDKKLPRNLKAITDLQYVGNQLESGDINVLRQILAIYTSPENAFYGTASELSALLLMRENKNNEAKELLTKAIQTGTLAPLMKERFQTLIEILEK